MSGCVFDEILAFALVTEIIQKAKSVINRLIMVIGFNCRGKHPYPNIPGHFKQ